MTKEVYINSLYDAFVQECGGYITIQKEVVVGFVEKAGMIVDRKRAIDILLDYVLSNDLADEVIP